MKLLSAIPLSSALRERLLAADPELNIRVKQTPWTQADLEGVAFAIGYPEPALLAGAASLELLQLTASGSEPYAAAPKRIRIAGAAGAYGELVSEYLLAALLAFYHNLHLHRNHQLRHIWASPQPVSTLRGKNILILGGGDIGCCFARRIRSQNARAIGVIRSRCISAHAFDRLCTLDELDELLPQADAVALCIPGTPENRHLFDLRRLRMMKPGSVLLNAGRGSLVDTEALCTVLREGPLGGAVLDVVEPEPLPPEHPLWDFENVILTPHDAGNFRAMPEALSDAIAEIACQNFIRFLHAQPLINAISQGKL